MSSGCLRELVLSARISQTRTSHRVSRRQYRGTIWDILKLVPYLPQTYWLSRLVVEADNYSDRGWCLDLLTQSNGTVGKAHAGQIFPSPCCFLPRLRVS